MVHRPFLTVCSVCAALSRGAPSDGRALWEEFVRGVGAHFARSGASVRVALIGVAVLLVVLLNVRIARRLVGQGKG